MIRMGIRERVQQHAIDDGKQRRVRADGEGERKYGDGREAWIFAEHSERVAEILPERRQATPPRDAMGVGGNSRASSWVGLTL